MLRPTVSSGTVQWVARKSIVSHQINFGVANTAVESDKIRGRTKGFDARLTSSALALLSKSKHDIWMNETF